MLELVFMFKFCVWRFDRLKAVDLQQGVHTGQRSNMSVIICHFLDDGSVKIIGIRHNPTDCFAASVCVCFYVCVGVCFFSRHALKPIIRLRP